MALIRSSLISSISGSIGGTTFARNRGGAYSRNRTVPINPNSASQTRARSSLATMSSGWSTDLTAGEREVWSDYAETQTVLNRLGEAITLTGQQAYVRSNTLLLLASSALVTAPPTITPPEIAVGAGSEAAYGVEDDELLLSLSLNVTGILLGFTSPAQAAGASSFKVPYRFFGTTVLAVDNAVSITRQEPGRAYAATARFATRFILVTTDGAVSNELFVRGVGQA